MFSHTRRRYAVNFLSCLFTVDVSTTPEPYEDRFWFKVPLSLEGETSPSSDAMYEAMIKFAEAGVDARIYFPDVSAAESNPSPLLWVDAASCCDKLDTLDRLFDHGLDLSSSEEEWPADQEPDALPKTEITGLDHLLGASGTRPRRPRAPHR